MFPVFPDENTGPILMIKRLYENEPHQIIISFDDFDHKFIIIWYDISDISYIKMKTYQIMIYHIFSSEACHRYEKAHGIQMTSGVAWNMAKYAIDMIKQLREEHYEYH